MGQWSGKQHAMFAIGGQSKSCIILNIGRGYSGTFQEQRIPSKIQTSNNVFLSSKLRKKETEGVPMEAIFSTLFEVYSYLHALFLTSEGDKKPGQSICL